MSRSAIDRLGKRLREADELAPEDLGALNGFISLHSEPLASAVRTVIEILGVEPIHRLKTHGTLLDKLRRPPYIQLSRIQDIAGMRVVVSGTRLDQDRAVEQICAAFEGAKVIDRREKPSHGYRAVHVILEVDGFHVEVQVRTVWQDRWAQIVEGLGDAWGRQIRYGEPPLEPDRPLPPGVSRARVWELILQISELIHRGEQLGMETAKFDARLSALPDLQDLEDPDVQALLRDAFEERDRQIRAYEAHWVAISQQMERLVEVLDELG